MFIGRERDVDGRGWKLKAAAESLTALVS